ncbi:MAG: prepilin-type N-terminal cleavage/methylation domain-containing protein [Gammaproteobacteria bacterium]|nr:prepilin-type N-terminal cleavage/methylation domain-containing protein [Gammaproteobacteria bacterium]
MSPSKNNEGVTLVELMIAMAVGTLLVLMAMVLYVPVSRSLLDQAAISHQSMDVSLDYDFDVMNSANAGYGVLNPAVNTNVVLVTGNGPGNNAQVPIPATGSAVGTGLFWSWAEPANSTTLVCAGLQVVPSTVATSGNDRLVYFEEVAQNGVCTGSFWNTQGNWDTVTVAPSIAATATAPITVAMGQNCDLRGAQIANYPVVHPAATFLLPIAATLTGGFFTHKTDLVPVSVCLRNLP